MNKIILNSDQDQLDILVLEDGKIVEKYKTNLTEGNLEGNVYFGKVVNVLPGMQAAFVDIGEEKYAYLNIKDVLPKENNVTGNKNVDFNKNPIKNFLKPNMNIVVQVKKDATKSKGARVSTNLNIAGKYVAIIPGENFVTISHKMQNSSRAKELRQMVEDNNDGADGFIVRTAAEFVENVDFIQDIRQVKKIYESIKLKEQELRAKSASPQKIYDAGGILNNVMLGLIDKVDVVLVNSKLLFERVKSRYLTDKSSFKLECKAGEVLISDEISSQLEKFNHRKIWLKCGGFITIDSTEALTAIDVNTGKFTGKDNWQKTVLQVNEEASEELAKQIRARDIGGIIIVDYIDMDTKEDEEQIIAALEKAFMSDRAKTQIVGFTKLHLLELTRRHLCSNE